MTNEFMNNPVNAEIAEAYAMLSDMHKDAYGFRCRTYRDNLTLEEINQEMDELSLVIKENEVEEKRVEEIRIEEFKTLIQDTIKLGAEDEKTALKWLFDASGIKVWSFQDVEHFVWGYGILFTDYAKHILTVLTELYHEGSLPRATH